MFNEGEVGGIAGGAICVEVRLEVFLEVRRGDEAKGRGDGGIVFKSGAMVSWQTAQRENNKCRNDRGQEGLVSLVLPPWLL
jgi:hypothetical protein